MKDLNLRRQVFAKMIFLLLFISSKKFEALIIEVPRSPDLTIKIYFFDSRTKKINHAEFINNTRTINFNPDDITNLIFKNITYTFKIANPEIFSTEIIKLYDLDQQELQFLLMNQKKIKIQSNLMGYKIVRIHNCSCITS